MNTKTLFLFLLPLLLPFVLQSQTSTFRGTVIDRQSETPLIGATIRVLDTDPPIGGITDADGVFTLQNVPVGRRTLL
ncbi:MAG: carboxypeptidase-like regulatory domain-containing protein, partial [Saprospiraceae bacterium]|nr:carboxypeptidase-like regulatory domain-containing protein [Saprospiraceae bacterium]